jgi:hypothetical protein
MSDFVRDDVRGGEVAGGPKIVLQFLKKLQVDIDVLVPRAVERSRGGGGKSTT